MNEARTLCMDQSSSGWWYFAEDEGEWKLIDEDELDGQAPVGVAEAWALRHGYRNMELLNDEI